MFLRKKLLKTVNIFFNFAITFSFGIQVLTFNRTKLDSFHLKIHIIRVNFGWILSQFWRKVMKMLALHTFIAIVSRKFAKVTRLFPKIFRGSSRKLRVNSRKFRVYSRTFCVNSRKLRVNSRNFRVNSRKLRIISRKL